MKLPSASEYPSYVKIGDVEYEIRFVRSLKDGPDDVGECDPSERVIRIKTGLSAAETFYTFIHECLHAAEDSYDLKISHKNVYKLEQIIGDFLLMNF